MAADLYGTEHLYGIGTTYPNATVDSFNWDEEKVNKAQVEDEIGNVIHRRYDDKTRSGSVTLILRSATVIPTSGSNITLTNVEGSNITFEVTKVGRASGKKDFRKVTIEIMESEYV